MINIGAYLNSGLVVVVYQHPMCSQESICAEDLTDTKRAPDVDAVQKDDGGGVPVEGVESAYPKGLLFGALCPSS